MTDWSKEEIKKVMKDPLNVDGSSVTFKVVSVEGDASIVYSRGKPRIGFDLTIKGTFEGDLAGEAVKGMGNLTI